MNSPGNDVRGRGKLAGATLRTDESSLIDFEVSVELHGGIEVP